MTKTMAWFFALGATALLYYICLSLIFKSIRAKHNLKDRWERYGNSILNQLANSHGVRKRVKSIQLENKLNTIYENKYFSLEQFEELFYRSGFRMNLKQHITFQIIGTAVFMELAYFSLDLNIILSFVLGFVVVSFFQFMFLKYKEGKWQKAFIKAFPLSLDVINRGLKSGLTLGRGIAVVAEEAEEPVGGEFNFIASQFQLGVDPDVALMQAANRIGVDEFRFFTLALIIQREVGGSLSEILIKLSDLIRERERFRNKVWTLSSESRTTAVIVGLLPVVLGFFIELVSPGYTKFFFVDPRGQMMLWVCFGLTVTGVVVISRMMRVES